MPLEMAPLLELLHGRAGADAEARLEGAPDPVMRAAAGARLAEARGRRPSVELLFHSLLPERYVLHTHPIVPNAVTCNADGEAILARLFGDEALWVPYVDPGLPLARHIHELRSAYEARHGRTAPRIAFMADHGIIVSADSTDEVAELCERVMTTVRNELLRAGVAVAGQGRAPSRVMTSPKAAADLVTTIAPSLRCHARRRGSPQGRDLRPGAAGLRLPPVRGRPGGCRGRAHDARPDRLRWLVPAALRPP